MWAICKTLIKTMFFIVKKCILNQTHDYWLIFNTLHAAFPISVSIQMDIQQFQPPPTILLGGILSLNYKHCTCI